MDKNCKLSVCTYNMQGYNIGLPLLREFCNDNDIIFVQEHFLQKSQLCMFDSISDKFMFMVM